jgi:hypothetical protein
MNVISEARLCGQSQEGHPPACDVRSLALGDMSAVLALSLRWPRGADRVGAYYVIVRVKRAFVTRLDGSIDRKHRQQIATLSAARSFCCAFWRPAGRTARIDWVSG